ncbi:MAG: carboxypeptidase-like regulatory domain-containing protein [Daejeonella sp.]
MKKLLQSMFFLLFVTIQAFAQNNTQVIQDTTQSNKFKQRALRGTVTAKDKGSAVSGISVSIPGTGITTKTDENGYFYIIIPDGAKQLEFAGYATQVININDDNTIDVKLARDINTPSNEVVYNNNKPESEPVKIVAQDQPLVNFVQDGIVSGVVTANEDGLPLPGVSVGILGINTGTQTDANGKFSIKVPKGSSQLTFTFIGYNKQVIAIGNRSSINVVLFADSKQLNEVVVTSFGIERSKKSLGYSSATLNNEKLTQAKVTNVSNALGAKIAGVRVAGSGGAFTGSSVVIRGFTTFTGSNQPLYVVDGVPIDNNASTSSVASLNGVAVANGTPLQSGPTLSNRAIDINPDDIETLTVLK